MTALYNNRSYASTSRFVFMLLSMLLGSASGQAQAAQDGSHLAPTGKGWAEERTRESPTVIKGNGIDWHGGPIMPGAVNVYYIWYGNWTSGPKPSDSQSTVNLLGSLLGATGGIGGSDYIKINTTYGDATANVSGNIALAGSTIDHYSQGTRLSDTRVKRIVTNAIQKGQLPKDANGIYFVLTSSDVSETSGFCTQYCGWHTKTTFLRTNIKYAFVGNPDRCPLSCEMQTVSPNNNSGADGMASIIAHEAEEALTDPNLNAWYDSHGEENADKCAWMFGSTTGIVGQGAYNQTFGSHHWLIQLNWENSRGGGCAQTLGGSFYNQ
jgi:hypothetical protein